MSKNPKNWKKVLNDIKKMRYKKDAPVDNYGAHILAEKNIDKKTYRYQVLTSLMLSSQTKDEITAKAVKRLQKYGLTIDNILKLSENKLNTLIKEVGFHNRKTKYILKTTRILKEEYNSDIPKTCEEILKLPGVGKKMCMLLMQIAWNKTSGISVDTHVHRISNRLDWVQTKKPERTQVELEDWLPKKYWKEINPLLVGFGQQICLPRNPKCEECLVNKYCPYYKKK